MTLTFIQGHKCILNLITLILTCNIYRAIFKLLHSDLAWPIDGRPIHSISICSCLFQWPWPWCQVSGSAKAQIQCWIISTTKATTIKLATMVGHFLCDRLCKRLYGLTIRNDLVSFLGVELFYLVALVVVCISCGRPHPTIHETLFKLKKKWIHWFKICCFFSAASRAKMIGNAISPLLILAAAKMIFDIGKKLHSIAISQKVAWVIASSVANHVCQ